jgi:hypothetical protein
VLSKLAAKNKGSENLRPFNDESPMAAMLPPLPWPYRWSLELNTTNNEIHLYIKKYRQRIMSRLLTKEAFTIPPYSLIGLIEDASRDMLGDWRPAGRASRRVRGDWTHRLTTLQAFLKEQNVKLKITVKG